MASTRNLSRILGIENAKNVAKNSCSHNQKIFLNVLFLFQKLCGTSLCTMFSKVRFSIETSFQISAHSYQTWFQISAHSYQTSFQISAHHPFSKTSEERPTAGETVISEGQKPLLWI